MKCYFGISHFLEEISSLPHSFVFLYLFALIAEEGFLSLLAILWNSAFKWEYLLFSFAFHFSSIHRPPQTTILSFCISFPRGWSWSLPPVQCHEPPSIVLQALLSDLIPWIYLSLPLSFWCHDPLGNLIKAQGTLLWKYTSTELINNARRSRVF